MENNVIDMGSIVLAYNFVIGILLSLSSQNIGRYAGMLSTAHAARISRLTSVSVSAFGAVIAFLSGSIYLFVHLLGFGV